MKVIAGVTQTDSHCGCRDQNPRSDFVLMRGTCEMWRSDPETCRGSERKTGQDVFREECFRELPWRSGHYWGTVLLFEEPVIPDALTFPGKKDPIKIQWIILIEHRSIVPCQVFLCLQYSLLTFGCGFGPMCVHSCQPIHPIPKGKYFRPCMIAWEITEAR